MKIKITVLYTILLTNAANASETPNTLTLLANRTALDTFILKNSTAIILFLGACERCPKAVEVLSAIPHADNAVGKIFVLQKNDDGTTKKDEKNNPLEILEITTQYKISERPTLACFVNTLEKKRLAGDALTAANVAEFFNTLHDEV